MLFTYTGSFSVMLEYVLMAFPFLNNILCVIMWILSLTLVLPMDFALLSQNLAISLLSRNHEGGLIGGMPSVRCF